MKHMQKDIWLSEKWMSNPKICIPDRKDGLRIFYDKEVHPEVKAAFQRLAAWIRERFYFPVRVNARICSAERVTARDGSRSVGLCFMPDNQAENCQIKIATGDYEKLVRERGTLQARIAIILPFLHELTHYYQWINSVELTPVGEERQAARYADDLMGEYLHDIGVLNRLDDSWESIVRDRMTKEVFLHDAGEILKEMGFFRKDQFWFVRKEPWVYCISVRDTRRKLKSVQDEPGQYFVNIGMAKTNAPSLTEKYWIWWHRCNTEKGELNLPFPEVRSEMERLLSDYLTDQNMESFLKRNQAFQSGSRWIIP